MSSRGREELLPFVERGRCDSEELIPLVDSASEDAFAAKPDHARKLDPSVRDTLPWQHPDPSSLYNYDSHRSHRRCWPPAYPRFRRQLRFLRQLLHLIKYAVYAYLPVLILCPIFFPSYNNPPAHYAELASACSASQSEPGCANPRQEQIFITTALYDKHGKLLGGKYGENLLDLIHILGEQNVFLSIYENDNAPDGIAALDAFRDRLPCRNELVHETHVSMDDFPTVTMPDGTQRTKRLAYLTELRNRAMRPLDQFNETVGAFDKILFLNDVFYNPIEAAQLLFSTNADSAGHEQYLAACALDYWNPVKFYDSYATRDADGFTPGEQIFPIFTPSGRALSRQDMFDQTDAVRVSSCWSGMVAMQAKWVQNLNISLPRPDFQDVAAHVIDPDDPTPVAPPIRFRYEPEMYMDACECCLFLADVFTAARKAGALETGVYMNPFVRVTYTPDLLPILPYMKYWERSWLALQTIVSFLKWYPDTNPYRTVQEGQAFTEEVWVSNNETRALGSWVMKERTGRNGLFCWTRKMHLVNRGARKGEKNWEHTRVPAGRRL